MDCFADTILRVLAKIDTEQLGKVFIEYAKSVFGNRIKDGDVIALDGKTECGSEYSPVDDKIIYLFFKQSNWSVRK